MRLFSFIASAVRFAEEGFEVGRVFQPFGLAEGPHHRGLIWQFVQEAEAAT